MKASSLNDIRSELKSVSTKQLIEYCLRLARYKKENKELLTYLLFDADNEAGYVAMVKEEIDNQFLTINLSNVYFVKKTLRKILRMMNRQIRYSGIPTTEIESRIYFCQQMRKNRIPLTPGTVISNLYEQQLSKIRNLICKLPEDIQGDYDSDLAALMRKP